MPPLTPERCRHCGQANDDDYSLGHSYDEERAAGDALMFRRSRSFPVIGQRFSSRTAEDGIDRRDAGPLATRHLGPDLIAVAAHW
jgi:hypothetical protein